MLRRPFESAQYTSLAFGQRCREAGVRPSMGSVGDCFDNAMCESFFATLECELLDRRRFKTQSEARMAVFEFIEGLCEVHGENVAKLSGSSGRRVAVSRVEGNASCYQMGALVRCSRARTVSRDQVGFPNEQAGVWVKSWLVS